MGIGVSNQREPIGLREFHRALVEVDPRGVEVTVFDGIEEMEVLQEIPVERPNSWIVRMRRDDQGFRTSPS